MLARRAGVVLTLVTIVAAAALLAEVRTVQALPLWFWRFRPKSLDPLLVAGALAVAAAALAVPAGARLLERRWRRPGLSLAVGCAALIALGYLWQHGLALSEGRGINGMRDRMLRTGHAEFARTASRPRDPVTVLTGYEYLVQEPDQRFARSKPPGQLLFYMALAGTADVVMAGRLGPGPADRFIDTRHQRLVNFATFVLPLLSYAVLVPLTLLALQLGPPELALWPAVLYVTAAAPSLITLHLDQALYPLLAVGVWALAARGGASERAWAWGVAAGVVTWLGLFASFSLAPVPLLGAVFACAASQRSCVRRVRRTLEVVVGMGAAVALLSAFASMAAGYDMMTRYSAAMVHHQAWKGWTGTTSEVLWAAGLDTIEFLYWLGVPTAALFLSGVAGAATTLVRRSRGSADGVGSGHAVIALGTAAILLAIAVTGRTVGEVARLWIFLVPAVGLVVTATCVRLAGVRAGRLLVVVAAASAVWTVLFKAKQDFW